VGSFGSKVRRGRNISKKKGEEREKIPERKKEAKRSIKNSMTRAEAPATENSSPKRWRLETTVKAL